MSENKTEQPTPKRKEEARKKGQVAQSQDVGGAVVLCASVLALGAFGPHIGARMERAMHEILQLTATPDVVGAAGLGALLSSAGMHFVVAAAPIAIVCVLAGTVASVAQVGLKPSGKAVKPDPKRMNPIQGAKQIFGPNALFEGTKNVVKVCVVGGIVALALFPELPQLAALVGMHPRDLVSKLGESILDMTKRAALAYLVIAAVDFAWQRRRHEKSLRMTKDEVRREHKDQQVSPELRGAIRRRQMEGTRARMMAAVPGADVVVTNPTHYAVALKYDGSSPAPQVVAKGQDLVALAIRRIAEEHGVPVVPDAPLARSLHGAVEVGHEIPESLYQAVAQLLAFVYRVAGRRAVA
jgi:flagellar biosynthesis protein FlhB